MKYLYHRTSRLDETDLLLVTALFENARLPMTDLARKVGLSAPSVIERVRRLEEAGVISSYHAQVDPRKIGLEIAAYIRIRPMPGQLGRVAATLADLPAVVQCDRITGEDCFIARVQVASVRAIQDVVDRLLPCATTTTSIIQSSPIPARLPDIVPTRSPRRARPQISARSRPSI